MKYLKVFTDFVADMKELGEAERGRLFTAMLEYAETGEEPALRGNERFLWGTAKKNIDNQRDSYDKRCEINRQNVTNRYESLRTVTNAYESKQEKDKDKDFKEKPPKGGKKKAAAASFVPPTPEEVQQYCDERKNGISGQAFCDWYTARSWYLSKGVKMRDWKAAVRTWEQHEQKLPAQKKLNRAVDGYEQHAFSNADVEHMIVNLEDET